MKGWDHKVSSTKEEMREIINNASRVSDAMGSFRIKATESAEKKKEFRRSIVINRKMKKGEIISYEDIDYKRPGGAFDPNMTDFVVGRTINKDLPYDHILTKEDLI